MRTESHYYEFTRKDLLLAVLPPLLVVVAFALAIHGGAATGVLPPPLPALDADRTILLHKATPNAVSKDADVVLIGDSSCMMDVSAVRLSQWSSHAQSVVNLGTVSYLDLHGYAAILARHNAARAKPFRAVVLLMHPEALRRPAPSEYHVDTLQHYFEKKDQCGPPVSRVLCALGVETFRGRILSRVLPQPLPGSLGTAYGFTHDLWSYLSAHGGSAFDPGQFDPATATGSAEYRLAPSLERASQAFRAEVPAVSRLLVGITPAPQSFVDRGYPQVHQQMLKTWGAWLNADGVVSSLPPTLPDELFASKTHLNKRGIELLTWELSRELDKLLAP